MNEVLKEIYGTWRDDVSRGWGEFDKKELHGKYLILHLLHLESY
jgi:hypothetical protein